MSQKLKQPSHKGLLSAYNLFTLHPPKSLSPIFELAGNKLERIPPISTSYQDTYRHPALPDQDPASVPLVELVEDVIDCLHLPDHHVIGSEVGGGSQEQRSESQAMEAQVQSYTRVVPQ